MRVLLMKGVGCVCMCVIVCACVCDMYECSVCMRILCMLCVVYDCCENDFLAIFIFSKCDACRLMTSSWKCHKATTGARRSAAILRARASARWRLQNGMSKYIFIWGIRNHACVCKTV